MLSQLTFKYSTAVCFFLNIQFKIEFVKENDPNFRKHYMNHRVLKFGFQNLYIGDDNNSEAFEISLKGKLLNI